MYVFFTNLATLLVVKYVCKLGRGLEQYTVEKNRGSRGCSTNTFVTHSLIPSVTDPL